MWPQAFFKLFPKFDVKLGSLGLIQTSGHKDLEAARRLQAIFASTEASLADTAASHARTLPMPFPSKSLPLPPEPSSAFTRRERGAGLRVDG